MWAEHGGLPASPGVRWDPTCHSFSNPHRGFKGLPTEVCGGGGASPPGPPRVSAGEPRFYNQGLGPHNFQALSPFSPPPSPRQEDRTALGTGRSCGPPFSSTIQNPNRPAHTVAPPAGAGRCRRNRMLQLAKTDFPKIQGRAGTRSPQLPAGARRIQDSPGAPCASEGPEGEAGR